MKNEYVNYKNITREILDSVKVGDTVKCNDWEESMKVVGVSDNYFVMVDGDYYSICEKKPIDHTLEIIIQKVHLELGMMI